MYLLNRDPVTSRGLPDVNLKLGSRRRRIGPATLLESGDSQSSRFVNGLGGYIDRMADSGRTREADSARPNRHRSRG
jgi:hypothetical protein